MLENDDSNLQTKVWSAYHFKYFQNNPILNHKITPNPCPPNFESLPYPHVYSKYAVINLKYSYF